MENLDFKLVKTYFLQQPFTNVAAFCAQTGNVNPDLYINELIVQTDNAQVPTEKRTLSLLKTRQNYTHAELAIFAEKNNFNLPTITDVLTFADQYPFEHGFFIFPLAQPYTAEGREINSLVIMRHGPEHKPKTKIGAGKIEERWFDATRIVLVNK